MGMGTERGLGRIGVAEDGHGRSLAERRRLEAEARAAVSRDGRATRPKRVGSREGGRIRGAV